MKRPWQVWLVFLVCVAAAGGGMAWLTRQALQADELRRSAEAKTELEQRVSLALWRMDTELAPLVAEEVIRPPSAYRAAEAPGQQFDIAEQSAVQPAATPAPNPQPPAPSPIAVQSALQQQATPGPTWQPPVLYTSPPPYVVLHFEARPDGSWVSPQVLASGQLPSGSAVNSDSSDKRNLELSQLAHAVKLPQLLAALPGVPAPSVTPVELDRAERDTTSADVTVSDVDPFGELDGTRQLFEGNTANVNSGASEDTAQSSDGLGVKLMGKIAKISKDADFQQRGERYQTATKQSLMNYQQRQSSMNVPANLESFDRGSERLMEEHVGVSRPVWIAGRLILARRVGGNGGTVVQGCWLNWSYLKKRLLDEVTDTLPGADLVRADGNAADDPSRMLAGLPVRLVVNETPAVGAVSPTLGWALWMGWGAVALAVLAAAALLHGVMTLSERRAAFVSSVTHELRTPLTTFRMYAEMLARGMVPDATRRQEYFETLQRESERLTLLVENVLAYARLERGRKPQGQDRTTLKALLARIGPRLAHRAAQADMECVVTLNGLPLPLGEGRGEDELPATKAPSLSPPPEEEDEEFTTDQSVVEQILFNLVDNAAKYAREAEDPQIHVVASGNGPWIKIVVRDHGPGIEQRPWGRAPRAFGKSAQQSAETAPGVGLGLALCRRLARQLGGRLEIADANGGGASVSLLLPRC